jgi:hypothetical protein
MQPRAVYCACSGQAATPKGRRREPPKTPRDTAGKRKRTAEEDEDAEGKEG